MFKKHYMTEERFQHLLSSAKEAVSIAKGERKAARRTIVYTLQEKLEALHK
jgi:uncharacterized protein YceH (UPF0502 family)